MFINQCFNWILVFMGIAGILVSNIICIFSSIARWIDRYNNLIVYIILQTVLKLVSFLIKPFHSKFVWDFCRLIFSTITRNWYWASMDRIISLHILTWNDNRCLTVYFHWLISDAALRLQSDFDTLDACSKASSILEVKQSDLVGNDWLVGVWTVE